MATRYSPPQLMTMGKPVQFYLTTVAALIDINIFQ